MSSPASSMLHPLTLGALVLLVVNDHVLKAQFPGFVTGKLSDVAGLAFFPILAWSLTELALRRSLSPRARIGFVVVTGVYFALAKTWAPAADLYRTAIALLQWPVRALLAGRSVPLVPASFVVDATDLIALPALVLPAALARANKAPP